MNRLFDAEDLHYAILYNVGDEGYGLTADELNAIVTGMQIAEYPEEPEMAETETPAFLRQQPILRMKVCR